MKFEINNTFFNLKQIVEKSFETMEYLAIEKKLDLVLQIDEQLKPFLKNINGDEG